MPAQEARQAIAAARPVAEIMDPLVYDRCLKATNHEEGDRVPLWDYIDSWELFQRLAPEETDPVHATAKVFNTLEVDFCRSINAPRANANEGDHVEGDQYATTTSGRTVWVTRFPVNDVAELKQFVGNLGPVPTLDEVLPGVANMVAVRDLFAPQTFYVPGHGVGFHQAYGTMSMDQFALMLYDAPREIRTLIEHYNNIACVVCEGYAEAKLSPFFFIGDDIAYKHRLMFSPVMLEELFFPFLKRMCGILNGAGIKVIYHSDGDITSIVPNLIECGVAGINPIETMAGMDVGFLKREYGRDLILVGGVDCSQVIPLGTPQTIRAEVKRILDEGARGGGMFIGSSSEIVPATPLENIFAFYDACKEFGRYPLSL